MELAIDHFRHAEALTHGIKTLLDELHPEQLGITLPALIGIHF